MSAESRGFLGQKEGLGVKYAYEFAHPMNTTSFELLLHCSCKKAGRLTIVGISVQSAACARQVKPFHPAIAVHSSRMAFLPVAPGPVTVTACLGPVPEGRLRAGCCSAVAAGRWTSCVLHYRESHSDQEEE